MSKKTAIIIGAGPAGVTAAYELLNRTDYIPLIFDQNPIVGGISRTEDYKGYKIDYGPHRFFSKSDRVMSLWQKVLPLQGKLAKDDALLNREIPLSTKPDAPDPNTDQKALLYKNRLTRILYLRKFFNYPIALNFNTIANLGLFRMIKIGFSYLYIKIFPIKKEKNLEDFFTNRFGRQLYLVFFKDYTEKVWGVDCKDIPSEWGAQRVKGLSITKVLKQALSDMFRKKKSKSIDQKKTETSLIERFMYPKYGAGQMYSEICSEAIKKGARLFLNHKIVKILCDKDRVVGVEAKNLETNDVKKYFGDIIFSTMPIKELFDSMDANIPDNIKKISDGLVYRDYMQIGLLFKDMELKNKTNIKSLNNIIPDNWIYVQEPDVKIGRLDIFNNFSVYMLEDMNKVWLGAEYFCNVGDELWNKSDKDMIDFVVSELEKINLVKKEDLLDGIVLRQEKAYPAYFGTYDKFDELKEYINKFENLFLVGRNGMHKYNNMDHSMLTAMTAVDNIVANIKTKDNIWAVNTEEEYHEEKK